MISKEPSQPEELKEWSIKYRLQNGVEGCHPISALEKNDLWEKLPKICGEKGLNFFEFETKAHRILTQSDHLIFFQFLFGPLCSNSPPEYDEDNSDPYAVKIYFTDNPNPMIFNIEVDQSDLADEGN